MKQLKQFIAEKLHISNYKGYNYHPETKKELAELINKLIKERGNEANLNDIDTSKIIDMSYLFSTDDYKLENFDGDISEWDVSNVKFFTSMFRDSEFSGKNGDLSNWKFDNAENMNFMFKNSKFKGNISDWKLGKVDKFFMFDNCPLEKNPPKWYHD